MNHNSAILVVGHDDIIDNSLFNYFKAHNFKKVYSSFRAGLDVLNQGAVRSFLKSKRIDYVFLSSTRSGGIAANQKYAAEFIYSNLESQNNIIHASYQSNVKKLMYFAGSCAYPKETPQPIKEKYLLTGPLESTSEPYSVAKIAGIKLCQAYKRQYGFNTVVAVPSTIYGPGSDVDITTAHVIGALIGKFHEAKSRNKNEVVVWGSGKPRREFLYADDFVDACLFLMNTYEDAEMINVGCGFDVSIKELAEMIAEVSGFKGKIVFDRTKPDGTMRKLMDNSRIKRLGWRPKIGLKEGIKKTYDWYAQTKESKR
ncbi:MAG TPA: GDP-L-fucose synthase [Candidatus Omnitrophota bacterium]|nr:GDP-L-fucose synthase [Candidatus Omnitrophota bacterium]HPD84141.1 GDP-L-fucose synthase [Candidatus Omnitrophota bacterium]HRZ02998.1 GDP-L-fucose synthase [Candidatus Omnitrophota bacterium]